MYIIQVGYLNRSTKVITWDEWYYRKTDYKSHRIMCTDLQNEAKQYKTLDSCVRVSRSVFNYEVGNQDDKHICVRVVYRIGNKVINREIYNK